MTAKSSASPSTSEGATSDEALDIAIVGMAGRFPGAKNIDEFWANLTQGKESILQRTDEELLAAGVSRRDLADPDYVKACPVLDDIDKFDAAFFGLSPRDASVMDPAHRFFLEAAWSALEHSGNTGLPEEGRVGVFAGSGAPIYWMENVRSNREIMAAMGDFLVRHTNNDMNFMATRVSYDLDLRGPSINVQTACSSALVAAHLARQSLLSRECDMALIGGSTIMLPMGHGYHYKEGEILSPDGHCRPFDHRSAGTVFGSGCAVLVLKRLSDALDNGDTIHAVIKGSAINNDGSVKVGFLAPGVDGQVGVIRDALKAARVDARSISYVEAHGTGTSVGDPIELAALEQAFSEQTSDKQFCGIGSVKSNIGHLGEAAAGASLIKLVLALKHRQIPPSLGYEKPNPRFPMDDSPFFVTAKLRDWTAPGPLRGAITALGAGGTNCHVILEEPPPALPGEGERARHLLVLSAKSKSALERMTVQLADFLEREPEVDLADVAYTLCMGRRALSHRRVLAVRDRQDAIAVLRGQDPTRLATVTSDPEGPEVVYAFSGGGTQYGRMCLDLYDSEPVFRAALDECLAIIDELDPATRQLLFAPLANLDRATRELQLPSKSVVVIFAVEYALAKLFESYGLRPAAFVGHSVGECVAACLAGVFTLREGLGLVHLRGMLFESTQPGRMVGVSLSEEETRKLMPTGLSLAAVNAPELCVVSGAIEQVEAFVQTLTQRDIDWAAIRIDVAAHSALLDPILPAFRDYCQTIRYQPPTKPFVSNTSGRWITAAEATDPEYWVRHLRSTVRFADCIETVLKGGPRVFVEIGPGRTLTTLVSAQKSKVRFAVNSVRHPNESANDAEYALLTLGKVWAAGATVDWTALFDGQIRNRVPLPTYPFDRVSYWLAAKALVDDAPTDPAKRDDMNAWFQSVGWDPVPLVGKPAVTSSRWLVLARDRSLALDLKAELSRLMASGVEIVIALPGDQLRRIDASQFELLPGSLDQYRSLLEQLRAEGWTPEQVVLLQASGAAPEVFEAPDLVERLLRVTERAVGIRAAHPQAWGIATDRQRVDRSFFEPVHVGQAIGSVLDGVTFTIVTEGAFALAGAPHDPFAQLAMGPAQVIPRELPDVATRLIDLDVVPAAIAARTRRVRQLARELLSGSDLSPVMLRDRARYGRTLRPVEVPSAELASEVFAEGDVVLITGGLGGMGLAIAEQAARTTKVRLALLSREGLPPRSEWEGLIRAVESSATLKRRLRAVMALENLGAEVIAVRGDVANVESLRTALSHVDAKLGSINVVIHAAGVVDDEPLQTKTDVKMEQVLAAKVFGARNLDQLIDHDLKLFAVMSSVASLLGLPGQVDYTAANAFLDAFAQERHARAAGRTIAINWSAWRDVGMLVDADASSIESPLPAGRTGHPWLDAVEVTPAGRRYFTDFSVARHWLLAEHQIAHADALIPGTGFVELMRAAAVDALSAKQGAPVSGTVELREVTFLRPFQVAQSARRRMQIDVEWLDDGVRMLVRTAQSAEVHATSEAKVSAARSGQLDLTSLLAQTPRTLPTRQGFLDQDFVIFGKRWQNIEAIRVGDREALLTLALPDKFVADLGVFAFHPALLDMATGGAQPLIPGFDQSKDFWVPFGYDAVRVFAPVAGRVHSHVRLRPETSASVAAFDVRVVDANGHELIVVEGFTMKRVDESADITKSSSAQEATHPLRKNEAIEALLREAITRDEGQLAFGRAVAQGELPQVVASSVDLNVWLRKLAREAERLKGGSEAEVVPGFARPDLDSDYVAPTGPLETQLAAIWSRLLGVTDVGVLDEFFALGGNSLIAVRFFAQVKKEFSLSLPLSTLFQAPTIRALATEMRAQGYVEIVATEQALGAESPAEAPSEATRPSVTRSNGVQEPLLIRPGTGGKPPLFLLHDGLGEVLLYRSLALALPAEHAVYGLPPEMAGSRYLHTTVEDMARAKIERIRLIQPEGPYLLAGLCAGGVVAFELARQLQDRGEQTLFVGLIDAVDVEAEEFVLRNTKGRLGRVRDTLMPVAGQSLVGHLKTALPVLRQKASNYVKYEVAIRVERARNARKVQQLRSAAPESLETSPEITFLKIYEQAHREHEPRGVFEGGDVVLFRATRGDGTMSDQPFRELYVDPMLGWGPRVAGPVQVVDVPGGHSSALQEPHVSTLAAEMQNAIAHALRRARSRA